MNVQDLNEADLKNLHEQGYTDADLGMLAAEEVKSLLAPESADDDGADPHERAAAEQDATAAAAAAAGNDTPPAAGADTAPGAGDTPAVETDSTAFVPQFKAEVPADAAEQIAKHQKEEADAFKALMDGTMDAETYQEVRARTSAAVEELKTAALTASIFEQASAQAAEQAARKEWQRAEAASMDRFKAEGLDYRAKPGLLAAYNVHLKALGADPKNERRDAPWFLAEAHRLTKEELGIAAKPAAAPATPTKSVANEEIPPTLRSVPVAGTNAVQADEFAHIRNLDGLALEKAVAGLTEAQRDRWMSE